MLNYANALGGYRAMTTVSGGALENRLVGDSQGLVRRLAEPVDADIYLGAAVRRVEHSRDYVRLTGSSFEAVGRRAVIAIPVPLAGRIDYDPALPASRDHLTQRMTFGCAIKYLLLYDEPFWRGEGLSGTAISHTSPVRAVMDGSPPDGMPGVLTVFVTGPSANQLARQTEVERREMVVGEVARLFGPRARLPFDIFEQDWMAEQYTRGCYHGYGPPGLYTEYGSALKRPIGRLHWAGAETVPIEFGSMSGAIYSGRRVAHEILEGDHDDTQPDDTQPTTEPRKQRITDVPVP
jgi:monoamine oxidase